MEDVSEFDEAELVNDHGDSSRYYEFPQYVVDTVFAKLRAARHAAGGHGAQA
ncbi:MAG: hypothetical protein JWR52_2896 [Marmoricola sp.]|nr:hypothetical protein [Marmoricola sp.]